MSAWTSDDLDLLDATDEVGVASTRPDGTIRPFVTIWAVRIGDDVVIRSAHGVDNPWNVRAHEAGTGRLSIGSVERDVTFTPVDADDDSQAEIDAAYRAKYGRFPENIVASVVSDDARATTLLVAPAE